MNERSIFAAALDITDPAERAAYLDRACGQDPGLRGHLEGLLAEQDQLGSFLARPLAAPTVSVGFDLVTEGPGTTIGPYKLLQTIGEGGMGVVYMAEQETPVRRKVALKIIKPGMDSTQVVARFEAERQALAMMDHQNIAKVFDAGTTDSGRPYFVMELVHGVPITEYCDTVQLTPKERLELFIPVCQAIQHAHQKGVIHRDIKPSNVLVTIQDGKPMPKVIDFGVAKAVEQRLTERSMFTQYGAIVGTLEYMSPEQAEMSALGVDTRTDVYALGVLLYELLTGSTPLERVRLRQSAYAEIVKRIREEEPPRPSTRLSESRELLSSIAAQRKTEPSKLTRLMRGDLDWIVMKALEKDRTRRYETAVGFARDVERYLKDEAVEACPPSAGYRLQKLARKHRTAMVTAASFVVLLMLGAIVSTWQAVRARQAEGRAFHEAARVRLAEQQTRAERDKAVSAQRETEAKRRDAEAARQSLRQSLYISDIQLAQTAWNAGNREGMGVILDRQRPRAGETDLRGFEWHYLRKRSATIREVGTGDSMGYALMSPDGTRCLLSRSQASSGLQSEGFALRLVDCASGRELRRIVPYPGETYSSSFRSLQFSPDGRRFLYIKTTRGQFDPSAGWGVKVWDWETGRELFAQSEAEGGVGAAAFDHTASRLVLGINRPEHQSSRLVIWDLDAGKPALTIPLPDRMTMFESSAAFSPDGSRLAALTWYVGPAGDRSIGRSKKMDELRVWDAATGLELYRQKVSGYSLAYSPDGQRIAVSYETATSHRVRDARSGQEVLELTSAADDEFRYATIAFSPDGSRLACASDDGKVRIWDVTEDQTRISRAPDRVLMGNSNSVHDIAWDADGRSVSSLGWTGKDLTWEIASREEGFEIQGPEETSAIATASADSTNRYAAAFETLRGEGKTEIKVWDETGKVLFGATEPAVENPRPSIKERRIRLNRHGTRLAYWASYRYGDSEKQNTMYQYRVWDVASGRALFRHDEEGDGFQLINLFLSADGRLLASTSTIRTWASQKFSLSVRDLDSGAERRYLDRVGALPGACGFSPDGRQVVCTFGSGFFSLANTTSELRTWETATARETMKRTWNMGDGTGVIAMAQSEDSRWIAVALSRTDGGGVIKVLDAATGAERLSLDGHTHHVVRLVFSPDGRRLASTTSVQARTAEVKLWDLAAGRELLSFKPQFFVINPTAPSISFSTDGHRLSYIARSSTRAVKVHVWDARPLPDDRPPVTQSLPSHVASD